jgi:hypothetical protein
LTDRLASIGWLAPEKHTFRDFRRRHINGVNSEAFDAGVAGKTPDNLPVNDHIAKDKSPDKAAPNRRQETLLVAGPNLSEASGNEVSCPPVNHLRVIREEGHELVQVPQVVKFDLALHDTNRLFFDG